MYGSSKGPYSGTYKVTKVFDENHEPRKCELSFGELVTLLSVRYIEWQQEVNCVTDKHREKYSEKTHVHADEIPGSKFEISNDGIEMMMEKLNQAVSDNYESWRSIGCTLYKLTKGSWEGKKMWHEFSSKSSKYKKMECDIFWERLEGKEINNTIGTLIHFYKICGGKLTVIDAYRQGQCEVVDHGVCECESAEVCDCNDESASEEEEEEEDSEDEENLNSMYYKH